MKPAMASEAFTAFYARELAQGIQLPQAISDQYLTVACLSSSEYKELYLLSQKTENRLCLLKQRPLDQAHLNQAEFDMLKRLDSSRIPKAVDCFTLDEHSYLIREFFDGVTLDQAIKNRGPLALGDIVEIALQLCDILQYLHTRTPSVIYRDLKPQNVVLSPDGKVRLIDFDISREFDPSASRDTVYMGTLATAPPEQYGYAQTDVRSDIYSFGVLMIFLGSGEYDIGSLVRLPPQLRKIAQKCTQFAPKDRPGSMVQVRRRVLSLRYNLSARFRMALVLACLMAVSFWGGIHYALTYPAAIPGLNQAADSRAGTTYVSAEGAVTFASAQIEQNVRMQLKKSASEPIYLDELKAITSLWVFGDSPEIAQDAPRRVDNEKLIVGNGVVNRGSVQELTDIPLFSNLSSLTLFGQKIEDISPLRDMKLLSLDLQGNYIQDLSALSQMYMLQILRVGYNPVNDISPLTPLLNLREFDLEGTGVYDLGPLAQMRALEAVNLYRAPGMDYSPLASLPRLAVVNMGEATLLDVSAVVKNKNLRQLFAHRCGITDLHMFEGMDRLERLELWGNDVEDLAGIEKLENLRELCLTETLVKDLQPLAGLKRLETLDIKRVQADLSPLIQIPTLKRVVCSADMKEQADKIRDAAKFTIVTE
jgi:serine/threonine protein kinase